MSSILKALKKYETDKVIRRDELKIDAEILRTDRPPRFSPAGILLFSSLLLAAGSGATYVYMRSDHTNTSATVKSAPLSRQNLSSGATVVSSPVNSEPQRAAAPVVLDKSVKPDTRQQTAVPVKAAAVSASPSKAVEVAKPADPENSPEALHSSPLPDAVKPVPALRVTGIAFQDGSAENMAMINGVTVSGGSSIDGVTVEEVYKNKVRFSFNGKNFEIPLGQSNR